ncbi:MAG: translation initiation factor IF-3 [bacterium]
MPVNNGIRADEVRVIDAEGKQLGILKLAQALVMAEEAGLDLVEVAPMAKPPVCKIMDYGKYKYQQHKRAQEAKKNQKVIHVKEIKLRPKTDDHDLQFKLNHARKFLDAGNKVKITIIFRGREMTHPDIGNVLLDRVASEIEELGVVEQRAKLEGRNMTMILAPKGHAHQAP